MSRILTSLTNNQDLCEHKQEGSYQSFMKTRFSNLKEQCRIHTTNFCLLCLFDYLILFLKIKRYQSNNNAKPKSQAKMFLNT